MPNHLNFRKDHYRIKSEKRDVIRIVTELYLTLKNNYSSLNSFMFLFTTSHSPLVWQVKFMTQCACVSFCAQLQCTSVCMRIKWPSFVKVGRTTYVNKMKNIKRLYICSVIPSVRPSVRPSIHPSIHLSIYLSIYLSSFPKQERCKFSSC
jgi:hypothetical protein